MKNDDISICLSGKKLYGDDFTLEEINKWFADEKEGYANLKTSSTGKCNYVYHELNTQLGFRYLDRQSFNEVLGLGSAYGHEFEPLANQINKITILDPSDKFSEKKEISGTPCEYNKPKPDGNMPFKDNQFDLITCFGVLHHIPNVSHVVKECYRCLNIGGTMLLREPIVSMGDWRKPRNGLTKRERGIPRKILADIIIKSGFKIKYKSLCVFPPLYKVANMLDCIPYNNYYLTMADRALSNFFSWNIKYHRTNMYQKFAPASEYFVVEK